MGLFKPAWMGKDEGKARRALDKVHDDATLAEIAVKCPHPSVQAEAVRRMSSDAALFVAIRDSHVPAEAKMEALGRASELVLADVVRSRFTTESIKLEAVARIGNDALLADIVKGENGFDETKQSVRDAAYERMERPPFECSMMVRSKRASENILLDLGGMAYPEDRDKLVRVTRERDDEAAEWAVSMLPYESERDTLRELAAAGKGLAQAAALASLRLPDDRDIVDAILSDPKSGKLLTRRAARLLPDDEPALDGPYCPYCGAAGSIFHHGGYDGSADLYYSAYECRECGHESRQWDYIGSATDFSVTLRELRDK